jgi:glucose-1-phosphate thymidylyltransferase
MRNVIPIILAGGFGKRTEGVLNHLPKTLIVTSDGKTILDHLIEDLKQNGLLKNISIVTNGKYYGVIANHIKKIYPTFNIQIINNWTQTAEDKLGALGDLMFTLKKIKNKTGPFLVLSSDTNYWKSFSIKNFLDFFDKNKNGSFVTVVRDVKDPKIIKNRFGCAVLNSKNEFVEFIEKPSDPPSTYASIPFYIYEKEHIALLKKYAESGNNLDSPGNVLSYFLKNKIKIKAFVVKSDIIDAGTPEDIERARKY